MPQSREVRLARLTGWLIPVQILLWWMLVGTLLYLGETTARLMPGGAYAVKMEAGAATAMWRIQVQFDLAANVLLVVFTAVLLRQLYKRKRLFRMGMVVLLLVIFVLSLIALGMADYAGELQGASAAAQLLFKVVQNAILAFIGTLYMLRSKRVKQTFVL